MHLPPVQNAVIVFADFVGSARLSEVLDAQHYDLVLCQFQKSIVDTLTAVEIPEEVIHVDGGVRGDELVLIMVIKDHEHANAARAAEEAIKLALNLNLSWFFSKENRGRIAAGASPHRIGVGIHYGPVALENHPRFDYNNSDKKWAKYELKKPEGYAINFAKRVEGFSRISKNTNITLSQSFFSVCRNAGLPIVVGKPLQGEMKGFELKEPVYELICQDIVTSCDQLIEEDNLQTLKKAFAKDPERTLLLMELAIETQFIAASKTPEPNGTSSRELFQKAAELAETAAYVIHNPERLLYRAARCYHRKDDKDDKEYININTAINYYEQSIYGNDPNLVWAANDAATAHWKLGTMYDEGDERRMKQFKKGKELCDTLIKREARHFYSYNLRALISAELAQELKSHQAPKGEVDQLEVDQLIEEARLDLKRASLSNPEPTCLYKGTEAYIEFAYEDYNKSLALIEGARKSLDNAIAENLIPAELFYQKGFAVVGFQPPRPEKLKEQWQDLEDRIKSATEKNK